jgi:Ca2+-binding RTX toxin-like protein
MAEIGVYKAAIENFVFTDQTMSADSFSVVKFLTTANSSSTTQYVTGNTSSVIKGHSGNDYIRIQGGNHIVYGESGNDMITLHSSYSSNDADKYVFGGQGDDTISTAYGDDYIEGNEGNDTISASQGNDEIHGGTEDDTIDGGAGNDLIYGDSGDDTIIGGVGSDTLHGGDGNDTIYATLVTGGADNGPNPAGASAPHPSINGLLASGKSVDTLYGGSGIR